MSIPQRYTRSRERLDTGNSTRGMRRGAARHRGHAGSGAGGGDPSAGGGGKLPSIGVGAGGVGAGKDGSMAAGRGGFHQPKAQQFAGGGKELVVREEGCATSGTYTIQVLRVMRCRGFQLCLCCRCSWGIVLGADE